MMQAEDISKKDEPPSTIDRELTMMSNNLFEGGCVRMKQNEGSTMKTLLKNTLKQS